MKKTMLVSITMLVFLAVYSNVQAQKANQANTANQMKTTWSIWKTINIGTFNNASAFRRAIKNANMDIDVWGSDILSKPAFTVTSKDTEIVLTRINVANLGFQNGATYKDIYWKAVGQTTTINGIQYIVTLCPAEVGPQLRLQYSDQSQDEWLRIAMYPIMDSHGDRLIFDLAQYSGAMHLGGSHGNDDFFWDGHYEFVFCLSKIKD